MSEATAHSLELWLAAVAVVSALVGFGVAFWLYLKQPGKPGQIAKSLRGVYSTLYNKYYVDEFYAAAIIRPLVWVSDHVLWRIVDVEMIDGTVNGIAHGARELGNTVRQTQSGNARSYAVWVVLGALAVIVILFWPNIASVFGLVGK